jgi:hypothetical protein
MARSFGIEIEAYGVRPSEVARVIRSIGIECNYESYNHLTRPTWKVVTDGSISAPNGDGFEVVSPILSGEEGFRQVREVMSALELIGAKVNKSCGLHVHIGAADFTLRQFQNLAKNYLFFEDFFDMIMPVSRRESANQYIKSMRDKFGGYDHAAAGRGMSGINACRTIDQVIQTLNGYSRDDRYYKLNLTAFWRHQTVEFRQHAGTVEADKAINWIKLVMAFVEKAAVSKIRPRKETTLAVSNSALFSQFFTAFDCKPLREYFTERRTLFAKREGRTL